ncbi:MAG: alkyl sulfatase dimerization domain-containing protein [Promethearchaeota archaeon]|jgi:alkyl sulfatase BDS1-like metallo-beta-lactamase superfamily hydrolase
MSRENIDLSRDVKAIEVLNHPKATNIIFDNPIKDVGTAVVPLSSCGWIQTTEGVVLIDTLISRRWANKVRERIKDKIKYIIYTHGHTDHVRGTNVFMDDQPEIIASKYLPDRLDKYQMLAPYKARKDAQQFNLPEVVPEFDIVYPTNTFLGDMTFTLGDKTFELHTARAETDDAVWVYVPELNAAFIGDLMIGSFPNIGNPWKPTRFALDWAKELERIRELKPQYIFYSGGGNFIKDETAMKALSDHIEVIRSLHDQVVDHINKGTHLTEMIHQVKIPEHLKKSQFLRASYSRPEFFVFNVYRWYHGYFDDNPAHLLPRPEKEVMKELYKLIGDPGKILKRVKELLEQNQAQLALEILDVLIQADPENLDARKLRITLLTNLGKKDYSLMSRNAWYYFINKDKNYVSSKEKE